MTEDVEVMANVEASHLSCMVRIQKTSVVAGQGKNLKKIAAKNKK